MNGFYGALVTALIWGIVPLIEKIGFENNDPILGVLAISIRVIVGAIFFALFFSPWKALGNL